MSVSATTSLSRSYSLLIESMLPSNPPPSLKKPDVAVLPKKLAPLIFMFAEFYCCIDLKLVAVAAAPRNGLLEVESGIGLLCRADFGSPYT